MAELRETAWNYLSGDAHGTFYSAERKWINKVHKLKEKYPDEVEIIATNPDGSVVVHFPEQWCKISPPKRTNLSQEQKDAARDRLAKYRRNSDHKSEY